MLKSLLAHPLTRGLDIDDPKTTELRRQIILEKRFLRKIYEEWYGAIIAALPTVEGDVLEIGSGGGFMGDMFPGLITSEMFPCPHVHMVLDGTNLDFADSTLRAIVMTDVLHHIPQPRQFFKEASRCIKPGGSIIMIEPWVTPWSRLVYQNLHHEPFLPDALEWELPAKGPLSGANGALPWIMFDRDRDTFEREFPLWRIKTIKPMMPFRYLVSGGVSLKTLMPGWSTPIWRLLERMLQPSMPHLAMFAFVKLVKLDN